MADTYFTLLQRKIDEYEEDIKIYLASGQAEDMEKYNRIVGRYEALTIYSNKILMILRRDILKNDIF